MSRNILKGLGWTFIILLFAQLGLAQDAAILTGKVTDPTGAMVVAAQVTVTNVATKIENTTQTNTDGMFRVPALRPGNYVVTITATGFKRFVRDNIELRVGAVVPIDAALEIGAVTDTVEVKAAIPLLDTETSATGSNVKGDYVFDLPQLAHYAKGVLNITPGVQTGNGWLGHMMGTYINGNPYNEIGYFDDGMYGTQPSGLLTTESVLNAVDEVKVITTTMPAEYGHSAGGAIVVVKKTGTNTLHGLAQTADMERAMQHRRFFQRETTNQAGSQFRLIQPDANLSGPVYIPKLYNGRNRTFFMFAANFLLERIGEMASFTVPTAEMLNGDFSFGGRSGVNAIYDPRTTKQVNGQWQRDPYPGNIIQKATWDPVATKFLNRGKVWQDANLGGAFTGTGFTDNRVATQNKTTDFHTYSGRFDHQLTNALKTFVTWNYNSRWQWTSNETVADPLFDSNLRINRAVQTTVGIGGTWVARPTLISETRLSYYRSFSPNAWPSFGTDYGALLGIPNIGKGSMPNITGIPYVNNPSTNVQESMNFKEDVSKLSGKHAFKMGYDLMRFRGNSYTTTNNAGTFTLTGTNGLQASGNAIPNTGGHSLSQLMSGSVSTATFSVNLLSSLPRNWIHSLYFQDDWKALPSLTLNLGLRWQVQSVANTKYGQQSSFDPNGADNDVAGAKGVITHPAKLYDKDWNNFQPRFGMAWQARRNIVVRSGFALATVDERLTSPPTEEYGSITARIDTPSGQYAPRFQLSAGPLLPLTWPVTRADGTIPYASTNYSSRTATWMDPNWKSPYSMNWSFGVQYNFSANYLVETTYTGNRRVNGSESRQINQYSYDWGWNVYQTNLSLFNTMRGNSQAYRPFTNFGTINFRSQGANSVYHAGTVKLEKRFSRGLAFQTYYTYSKSIDSSSTNQLIPRSLDRARSSFSQTHAYTGSMNYEIPFGKGRKWLNQGGVWNAIFGNYNMVFLYRIASGMPLTFGMSGSPYNYMPGNIAFRSGRPNSTGQSAHLREGWTDLGADRWTRANQNKTIVSMDYFTYPAAYTTGNVGRNTMDRQRFIENQLSASKEWRVKERYTFQFRFDFNNPFKWYNVAAPDTTVNFTNPASFGTITPSAESEQDFASAGGQPAMNITVGFRF
jgi:hypothetical protein